MNEPAGQGPPRLGQVVTRARPMMAVAEVCVAFAAMHVAFRAFKRWTAWGRWELDAGMNISPGVAMIAVALVMIMLRSGRSGTIRHRPRSCRRHLGFCGLTPRPLFPSLNAALACLLVLGIFGAVLALTGVQFARSPAHWPEATAVAGASLPATCAVLWVLRRAGSGVGGPLDRVPRALGLVHVLNTADYFAGIYRFAWQHGLTTFATFFYGFLRERTGNIVAPAAVHFFTDLGARWPALMGGG